MGKTEFYTIRRLLLSAAFMLLACIPALADEVSKTVALTEAGTLSNYITDDEKYTITSLKVSGPINGADVLYLRQMAGKDLEGNDTDGALVDLDLADANIVSGGGLYYNRPDSGSGWTAISGASSSTKDNVLGDYMFDGCRLQSIKLPNSVTSIEYRALSCGLTSVTFGNSVTSIGYRAFLQCTGLTSITIPKSVTSIGQDAFRGCGNLTSVTFDNSATSIGEYAFFECGNLTSVTFGNSVTSIGQSAFKWCGNLASVTIPSSVTSIGEQAFYSCGKLTSVTFDNCKASISYDAFGYCTNLNEVILKGDALPTPCEESAFTGISSDAALYCDLGMEETCSSTAPWSKFAAIGPTVTLTEAGTLSTYITDEKKNTTTSLKVSGPINGTDVLYLREMAGSNVEGSRTDGTLVDLDLTDANIVKGGDTYYRYYDYNFSHETINYGITDDNDVCDNMFTSCKLQSIKLPNSATSIGECAFDGCSSLISVIFPNSVTSIGAAAFRSCSSLTSITIPKDVTSIGSSAFNGCSGLTSFVLPEKVTSIGVHAFMNCSGLTSVTFGKSAAEIQAGAFFGCSSLEKVIVEDVAAWCGTTFEEEDANPLLYAHHLYSDESTEITDLEIPNSATKIGDRSFIGCSSLTSVTIPSTVTSIEIGAFKNCSNIASITIASSAMSIKGYVFEACSNLKEMTLLGNALPECAENVFYGNSNSNATLYCKASLVEACRNTDPWKNFKNIAAKPFSITISDAGIATACFSDDLDFTDVAGVKAYIASGFNPETGDVLLTRATAIPAGTGFVVKGDAGTYEIPAVATKYMYANLFVGTLAETTLSETSGSYSNYVLDNGANGVGFYLPGADCVLPANKAYLHIPTAVTAAKASLGIYFDDEDGETTGIISAKELLGGTKGNKTAVYDLSGRRKQGMTKGLNIVNGKKILIK